MVIWGVVLWNIWRHCHNLVFRQQAFECQQVVQEVKFYMVMA